MSGPCPCLGLIFDDATCIMEMSFSKCIPKKLTRQEDTRGHSFVAREHLQSRMKALRTCGLQELREVLEVRLPCITR